MKHIVNLTQWSYVLPSACREMGKCVNGWPCAWVMSKKDRSALVSLVFYFYFFYFRQLTIYNLLAKLLSRGDLRITGVGHLFQRTLLTPHQDTNQRCQRTRQAYAAGKAKCDYFKTISEITVISCYKAFQSDYLMGQLHIESEASSVSLLGFPFLNGFLVMY